MRKKTSNATTELQDSRLVQRLKQPYGGRDNPFAFGGGYKNGGLSDEAMDLLRGIFSFDYMGSAEFEFGAVPEALNAIAQNVGRLTATSFEIALSDVAADFRDKGPAPEGLGTVYVLCPRGWETDVEARIRGWAAEGYNADLKESTHLSRALRPKESWDQEIGGWLELDNGFMFFTDRDMWTAMATLFSVEPKKK